VGINIRTSEPVWKGLVETSGLSAQLQYRSADFDALTKALIIDKPNKCIITENDLIVDAFANVYGPL
ncbi:MAG TPA: transaldolase, partial [Pricia sp.]|nr:transaldolase [Pricia sp.]